MAVTVAQVVWGDAVQPDADGLDHGVRGTRLGATDVLLERREHQLDWVEIRRPEQRTAWQQTMAARARTSWWTDRLSWTTICPGRSIDTTHSTTH